MALLTQWLLFCFVFLLVKRLLIFNWNFWELVAAHLVLLAISLLSVRSLIPSASQCPVAFSATHVEIQLMIGYKWVPAVKESLTQRNYCCCESIRICAFLWRQKATKVCCRRGGRVYFFPLVLVLLWYAFSIAVLCIYTVRLYFLSTSFHGNLHINRGLRWSAGSPIAEAKCTGGYFWLRSGGSPALE